MIQLRKKQPQLQSTLDCIAKKLLLSYNKNINYKKYKGYVTDTIRGMSHYDRQYTVPFWAYKKGKKYFTYYVAHELSHQIRFEKQKDGKHDKKFYEIFMKFCPQILQHFEIKYIKTSIKYGIREK